jgi:hypothetical protein
MKALMATESPMAMDSILGIAVAFTKDILQMD